MAIQVQLVVLGAEEIYLDNIEISSKIILKLGTHSTWNVKL